MEEVRFFVRFYRETSLVLWQFWPYPSDRSYLGLIFKISPTALTGYYQIVKGTFGTIFFMSECCISVQLLVRSWAALLDKFSTLSDPLLVIIQDGG